MVLTALILQGCNDKSKEEKQEIVEKSTGTAVQYFKEQKGWDVVTNEHDFTDRTDGTEIFLFGYEKGNKDNRVHAKVNFSEGKYEVSRCL